MKFIVNDVNDYTYISYDDFVKFDNDIIHIEYSFTFNKDVDLINNTLEYIKSKTGLNCYMDKTQIFVRFSNTKEMKDYVYINKTKYNDSIIFMKKCDKILMNECLFHILWYVCEAKLLYKNGWVNSIQKPNAKIAADIMLKMYNL